MATVNGLQYAKAFVTVPAGKIDAGDLNGEKKVLFFSYALAGALSSGDIVKLGKIPKGARVLDITLEFPDLGTTGLLHVGWAVSAEKDAAGTALEAADADGFMVTVNVNSAAAIVNMADVSGAATGGFCKKFLAECDLQLEMTESTTASSGTIKGYLEYIV